MERRVWVAWIRRRRSSEGLQVTETCYRRANKPVIFLFYCAAAWASRLPAVWIPLINNSTVAALNIQHSALGVNRITQ